MSQENAFPLGDASFEDEHSIVIELEAHDMSRFEWRVAVPLPVHEYLNHTVQHDSTKSIPVLDAESGRTKFVGAPRRYQMPIRVSATLEERRELNASLILDKDGIVRIEFHANGNC